MGWVAEMRDKPRWRIHCMWLNFWDAKTGLRGQVEPYGWWVSFRYAIGSVPIFGRYW